MHFGSINILLPLLKKRIAINYNFNLIFRDNIDISGYSKIFYYFLELYPLFYLTDIANIIYTVDTMYSFSIFFNWLLILNLGFFK